MNMPNTKKIPCPECHAECTGINRLKTHIRGAHWKDCSDEQIRQKVYGYKFENKSHEKELLRQFKSHEPELNEHDERCISELTKDATGDFLLDSYLGSPVCREERQYALMLSVLLENNHPDYLNLLFSYGQVLEVFYEAAIMRDFHKAAPVRFNSLLKTYIEKKFPGSCHTGKKEYAHPNYWQTSHPLARWMMNAKPDIGIVSLCNNNRVTLAFLECKYKSGLDTYSSTSPEYSIPQDQLQEIILDFVCNHLKSEYVVPNHALRNKCTPVEKGNVRVVRFVNPNDTPAKQPRVDEVAVSISKLLADYRQIFKKTE